MSFQDLLGLLQSAKAFSESAGIDPERVTLLVAACVTLMVALKVSWWGTKVTYRTGRAVVRWALPKDELRDEILAALRGQRGVVVTNPEGCEVLTERMTVGYGCKGGHPAEILFVKADGQYQPLKALSAKAKREVVSQIRAMVRRKRERDVVIARENFLDAIRSA